MYLAKKTLHFKKIVAVSYGVFAQFLSKIYPNVLVFGNKVQIRDGGTPNKNVTY